MTEPAVRLPDVQGSVLPIELDDTRVSYWRQNAGDGWTWWIYLPRAGAGRLTHHQVTEHEDRTITVSPSIGLRSAPGGGFTRHGFLERGLWREC